MEEKDLDFLLMKRYNCTVCGKEFRRPALKTGKARQIGSDMDLRPKFQGVDSIKYDVVACPHCGYATLERYFKELTNLQKSYVEEKICDAFEPFEEIPSYTYEEAFARYRLALMTAVAKQGPDSEKAYISLKTAWLLRGWQEYIVEKNGNPLKVAKLKERENEFLKRALDGFIQANMKEDYPLCGMDEPTVDYLVAALHSHFDQFEPAIKLLSGVIASRTASNRVKDRARDLKDEISARMKA